MKIEINMQALGGNYKFRKSGIIQAVSEEKGESPPVRETGCCAKSPDHPGG
jgi:hypothetical protein